MKRLIVFLSCAVLLTTPARAPFTTMRQATAAPNALGGNLIVNGDAESSPGAPDDTTVLSPAGWKVSPHFSVVQYGASGGFPGLASPGPILRGKNFFAGGPDAALSTATQHRDVSSAAIVIDRKVLYTVSGYFGGYTSQGDFATLTIQFLNASGTRLGSVRIGDVTPRDRNDVTGLLKRSATGRVPPGTRSISIVLTMTRKDGSYNDGSADNLSLVLRSAIRHKRQAGTPSGG